MHQVDYQKLARIVESAGFEPESYSGRGMDGARCLSFTTAKRIGLVMSALVDGMQDSGAEPDVLAEALRSLHTDSMGLETVYYFTAVRP